MEEKQSEASPQIKNVVKYLRSSSALKNREGILNGKRVAYFKGRSAIKALLKESYGKLKDVPTVASEAEAGHVLEDVLGFAFYLRVERSAAEGPTRNKSLTITPVQSWADDYYYVWFYEGSQLMNYLGGLALITVVFAAVLFPLWPVILRDTVWYISVAILSLFGAFMVLAVFRLLLFIVTMILVPPGIWLFPNLFEDVGFFDSFAPLWGWEVPKKKENVGRDETSESQGDRDRRTTVEDGDEYEKDGDKKND